jgi:hypothetical protein
MAGIYEMQPANARVHDTRTAARDALYRAELPTASDQISHAVRVAFEAAESIKRVIQAIL